MSEDSIIRICCLNLHPTMYPLGSLRYVALQNIDGLYNKAFRQ